MAQRRAYLSLRWWQVMLVIGCVLLLSRRPVVVEVRPIPPPSVATARVMQHEMRQEVRHRELMRGIENVENISRHIENRVIPAPITREAYEKLRADIERILHERGDLHPPMMP